MNVTNHLDYDYRTGNKVLVMSKFSSKSHEVSVHVHLTDARKLVIMSICPWCGRISMFEVDKYAWNKGLKAYSNGACIRIAWPTLTLSERELIMTGICDDCWSEI